MGIGSSTPSKTDTIDYIKMVKEAVKDKDFMDKLGQVLKENGVTGPAGVGISDAAYNSTTGNLLLTKTDGSKFGPYMIKGNSGVGISDAAYNSTTGNIEFIKTDGSKFGPYMIKGNSGVGISDASYDSVTGNLLFTRTDGANFGPFMVKGDRGLQGQTGPSGGPPGPQGPPGPKGELDYDAIDYKRFMTNMMIVARMEQGMTREQARQSLEAQSGEKSLPDSPPPPPPPQL
jgi:hypothetical protein